MIFIGVYVKCSTSTKEYNKFTALQPLTIPHTKKATKYSIKKVVGLVYCLVMDILVKVFDDIRIGYEFAAVVF